MIVSQDLRTSTVSDNEQKSKTPYLLVFFQNDTTTLNPSESRPTPTRKHIWNCFRIMTKKRVDESYLTTLVIYATIIKYLRKSTENNIIRRQTLKNTITQIHTITLTLILLMLTTVVYGQVAHKSIQLPEDATKRLGKGRIYNMQYTEDGTRLALATTMGVWIYDTIAFTELYLLKEHDRRFAEYMAFSPDGKILATADRYGDVNLWDTDTGEHQQQLKSQEGIAEIVFGTDGDTFAILSTEGSVILWDMLTWEEEQKFTNILSFRDQGIFGIALSPNSFNILTGHQHGLVAVYDPLTNAKIKEFDELKGMVTEVVFSSDDKFVAAADYSSICWWDTEKEEMTHNIGENLYVSTITFSPEDSLIATGSQIGDIRLWDVNTGEQRQTMKGHTARVIDIAFSSDLRTVASASIDGSVRIWDVFSGKALHIFDGHFGNFSCFDVSPDGTKVVAPTMDLTVCLWDVASGKLDTTFDKEGYFGVAEVAFSPTQNIIATASYGKFISIWDRETDKLLKMLKGHEESVLSTAFSPNGKTLVSGSKDKTVRLWDVETLEVKHVLEGHQLPVTSVAFSPDGTTFASGGMDAIVRLWDANTGEIKHVLGEDLLEEIDPDEAIIVGAVPGDLVLTKPELAVLGVAFSPDSTTVASISKTANITLWDVATGEQNRVIVSDEPALSSILFHPDGKVIVTGSQSGVVQLFDVATGETLRQLSGHLKQVTDLAFASGGTTLISRSDDGVLYVWDVPHQ